MSTLLDHAVDAPTDTAFRDHARDYDALAERLDRRGARAEAARASRGRARWSGSART
ncbi:hypothetical protein tb265_32650 [Gemmatimonadetes bacterium T265]|nr:hypothetical protein tb265_32650 [Gemmatimonadetes bacterium T265]